MTIQTFIDSTDSIVANAAILTNNAMSAFRLHQITAIEYSEIMANILDLGAVTKLTDDMQRKNSIVDAFNKLKEIAGAVSALTSL
jgi:hypothetical protein